MHHIRSELLQRGVPAQHIRYEVFGPDLWAAQGRRRLDRSPGMSKSGCRLLTYPPAGGLLQLGADL